MKKGLFWLMTFLSVVVLLTMGSRALVAATWEEMNKAFEEKWQGMVADIDGKYLAMDNELEARWARLQADVERKWQVFARSTNKDWVAYNRELDSRSKVDFEQGKVVLETVVREDDPIAGEDARRKIEEQAERIFGALDKRQQRILEDQFSTKAKEKVGPDNLRRFLKEEVLPDVKPDPMAFQSRDGVTRRRYGVEITMVPNHIRVRAEKYLPFVEKKAKHFGVEPQLIFAVIHTESYFNPEAISHCNAIGLMQIIPKYAGREAYRFVYGKDAVITPGYLFDPEKNIELGSAYLHLLIYQHFADVKGPAKNRYVSICGYNWGPTSMRSKIVDRYPIPRMSDEEVYSLLRTKTPEETREYVKTVRERMPIYDTYFSRG